MDYSIWRKLTRTITTHEAKPGLRGTLPLDQGRPAPVPSAQAHGCTRPDSRSQIRSSETQPGPARPPPPPGPGTGANAGRERQQRRRDAARAAPTGALVLLPARGLHGRGRCLPGQRPAGPPLGPEQRGGGAGRPAAGGGPGAQAPLQRDAKRPPGRGPRQPRPGPAEHSPGPGSPLGSGRRLGGGLLGGGPGPGAAPPAAGILSFTATGGGGSSSSGGSRCGRDGGGRGPAPLPAAPQHPATAGLLPLLGGGQRRTAAARGRRPLCHCGRALGGRLLLGAPRLLRARRHQGSERWGRGRCALLPPARQTSPAHLSRGQSPPTPTCTSQSASVGKVTVPPQAPPPQPEALPPFSAARAPPGQ